MAEYQKNIISHLLKRSGKTKRELAAFLDIHENGINRLIGNSKISMERLEQIAQFLDMSAKSLFDKIHPQTATKTLTVDSTSKVMETVGNTTEEIILLLSEVVKGQKAIRELGENNAEKLSTVMDLLLTTFKQ